MVYIHPIGHNMAKLATALQIVALNKSDLYTI
jgi:hypothetical protein